MLNIHPAFDSNEVISGVTMVGLTVPLSDTLGIEPSSIVTLHQVHGNMIHVVPAPMPLDGDGLCTNTPGIVIAVKIADCAGVLMWDDVQGVVAAVHTGWRGTSLNICSVMIEGLYNTFRTEARNLQVYVSPHASGNRYEVGTDVFEVLPAFCSPIADKQEKWLFDNGAAISSQLQSCGVIRSNIKIDPACTISDARFHSFRRDKAQAGRSLAFIGLKPYL